MPKSQEAIVPNYNDRLLFHGILPHVSHSLPRILAVKRSMRSLHKIWHSS
ncbi:MAG: hypothetical protein V7L22_02230 [Nostoc sp.]